MPKIDSLKEEIGLKREFLRGLIILGIGIISGIVAVFYNVSSGTTSIYMLIFIGFGFVAISIIIAMIKELYLHIEKIIKDLKNV